MTFGAHVLRRLHDEHEALQRQHRELLAWRLYHEEQQQQQQLLQQSPQQPLQQSLQQSLQQKRLSRSCTSPLRLGHAAGAGSSLSGVSAEAGPHATGEGEMLLLPGPMQAAGEERGVGGVMQERSVNTSVTRLGEAGVRKATPVKAPGMEPSAVKVNGGGGGGRGIGSGSGSSSMARGNSPTPFKRVGQENRGPDSAAAFTGRSAAKPAGLGLLASRAGGPVPELVSGPAPAPGRPATAGAGRAREGAGGAGTGAGRGAGRGGGRLVSGTPARGSRDRGLAGVGVGASLDSLIRDLSISAYARTLAGPSGASE